MSARTIASWFVGSMILGLTAVAAELPEALFILDGSGSMAAGVGSEMKMDIAKRVLRQVVPQLPPEVKVGLAAYGHRQKGNCEDVEILLAPGRADRDALLARADGLRPVGMTPIALAVTRVAETLKTNEAETTIVLVSDGQETCGGDPCAVVKALKASGAKFVMHVVGFDVDDATRQQLECMAVEGGGSYFSAQDAAGLLAALNAVKLDIEQKVEKARTTTVKKRSGLGKLRLAFPEDARRALSGIKLVRASDGKVIKDAELSSADSTHPLPSGDYTLVLKYANPNYKPPTEVELQAVTVEGGATALVELGAVAFNLAPELEEDAPVEAVLLLNAETGATVLQTEHMGNGYYLFKAKALPAGLYNVALRYARSPAPTVVAEGLEVAPGRTTHATLDSGLALNKPSDGGVTGWDLHKTGEEQPFLEVRRRTDNDYPLWRSFVVPPGAYDIYVRMDGMSEPLLAGEGVEVSKGELLRFDSGL